ncbi:MAG: YgfZ/GcvT domain-containing protein [Verrucomicrobiales bacterium]
MGDALTHYLLKEGAKLDPLKPGIIDFGNSQGEYRSLTSSVGLIDFSHRSRVCLLGADRKQFLHGQVTNNIKQLEPGHGCRAALVTAKGKVESDLNVYCLEEELLLDFEPGYAAKIMERLEKYIIADDVQVVDVAPHFMMLSAQGPKAAEFLAQANIEISPMAPVRSIHKLSHQLGFEFYAAHLPRFGTDGWDLFVPTEHGEAYASELTQAVQSMKGGWAGETACELARIEAGIPRFGIDFDESNLAPETGLESDGIHYSKGCYIGQEVIARIRTYGQVAKALRVLQFDGVAEAPRPKTKLIFGGREVGYVTSAILSHKTSRFVGLGYLRKEVNKPGDSVAIEGGGGTATVAGPPVKSSVSQPR